MSDFEQRKIMWLVLSKLFEEEDPTEFIWMFSKDDMEEANPRSSGAEIAGCCKDCV